MAPYSPFDAIEDASRFFSFTLALALFAAIWAALYSLNPDFVQVRGPEDLFPRAGALPDPMKCFTAAALAAVGIAGLVGVARAVAASHTRAAR